MPSVFALVARNPIAPLEIQILGWTTSFMIVLERSRTLDLLKRPSSVRLASALRTFSITNSSVSEVSSRKKEPMPQDSRRGFTREGEE